MGPLLLLRLWLLRLAYFPMVAYHCLPIVPVDTPQSIAQGSTCAPSLAIRGSWANPLCIPQTNGCWTWPWYFLWERIQKWKIPGLFVHMMLLYSKVTCLTPNCRLVYLSRWFQHNSLIQSHLFSHTMETQLRNGNWKTKSGRCFRNMLDELATRRQGIPGALSHTGNLMNLMHKSEEPPNKIK